MDEFDSNYLMASSEDLSGLCCTEELDDKSQNNVFADIQKMNKANISTYLKSDNYDNCSDTGHNEFFEPNESEISKIRGVSVLSLSNSNNYYGKETVTTFNKGNDFS